MPLSPEAKARRVANFRAYLTLAATYMRAARDEISEPAPKTRSKLRDMAAYCDLLIDRAAPPKPEAQR